MKRTGKTTLKKALCTCQFALLVLGSAVALLTASLAAEAYARGPSNNMGWYHGMTSVAEQKVRTKDQKELMENTVKTAANTVTTTDFERECVYGHEKHKVDEK